MIFRSLMIIAIQLDAESLCLGQIFEVHLPQTRPGGKSLSGPIMGPNESLARTVSWVVQWSLSQSGPTSGKKWEDQIRNQIKDIKAWRIKSNQWQYQIIRMLVVLTRMARQVRKYGAEGCPEHVEALRGCPIWSDKQKLSGSCGPLSCNHAGWAKLCLEAQCSWSMPLRQACWVHYQTCRVHVDPSGWEGKTAKRMLQAKRVFQTVSKAAKSSKGCTVLNSYDTSCYVRHCLNMICKSVSYYSVQLCIGANADWVNDLLVSPSTSDKENQGTSMA